MLLKKSLSTADQNFSRPLMRFSDKKCEGPRLLVKKLTGGFDNGLGAILIGDHSLGSFLSKKSPEGISDFFNSIDPDRPPAVHRGIQEKFWPRAVDIDLAQCH
jgi:hypothetical protein